MRTRLNLLAAGLAAGVALLVTACGGSSTAAAQPNGSTTGSSTSSRGLYGSAPPTTTMTATGAAMVSVRSTSLGRILVDDQGKTLYLFEKDKGPMSTCSGQCAQLWPPLTSDGAPQAGSGVTASKLGTSKRSDGTMQVTYLGHPLYGYVSDQQPGDTTGQGLDFFGGEWYVLSPKGDAVTGS